MSYSERSYSRCCVQIARGAWRYELMKCETMRCFVGGGLLLVLDMVGGCRLGAEG